MQLQCASVKQVLYEGICFVFSINTCTNLIIMHKLVVFEEAQGAIDSLSGKIIFT